MLLKRRRVRSSVNGSALIFALFFIVISSVLGVSMFKNLVLDERLAGNTREKERSFQTAENALRYGEWWLEQGNGGTGVECTEVVKAPFMQTCSNTLINPTALPWPSGIEYIPEGMQVNNGGGIFPNADGDIYYYRSPALYIQYVGQDSSARLVYQLTAAGYGGTESAASVVRSVYAISSGTTPLDQP